MRSSVMIETVAARESLAYSGLIKGFTAANRVSIVRRSTNPGMKASPNFYRRRSE